MPSKRPISLLDFPFAMSLRTSRWRGVKSASTGTGSWSPARQPAPSGSMALQNADTGM
jgi:hypothetical protein